MAVKSALWEQLILSAPHLSSRQTLPAFIYGTAWKQAATAELVYDALRNGFSSIDTAAQPKHYQEHLVADGLRRAIRDKTCQRSNVFIQTKFTSIHGQDPTNMPYKAEQALAEQVNQSVASSLKNFDMSDEAGASSYLDSVVLHSPLATINETMEVWRALEAFVPHRILNLGISNVNLFTLMDVYERARVKPAVVQNRFYPSTKFDVGLRKYCEDKGIIYQSFWTATANPELLASKVVRDLSSELTISPQSALYCLVLGLGNTVVLNGTTKAKHMKDDWEAISLVKDLALSDPSRWESIMVDFRKLLGYP